MKWVSTFLVVVATPLVLVAAFVFVPIGWLGVGGVLFLLVGAIAVLASRDRDRRRLLDAPADLRRGGDGPHERSHPVHRGRRLGSWMRR